MPRATCGSRSTRSGQVFVHGALWRAEPADGLDSAPIPAGARVRVESVDGLTLMVRVVPGAADVPDEGAG